MSTDGKARTIQNIDFSILFFASGEDSMQGDKYHLLIESAKFADRNDFATVWVPERHFTRFGCLYPNPALLHASLAMVTERVRLCSGSVVMPLHDPIRVAEEWSVVDNLSRGRIGLSVASGWNPDDFVLSPDRYEERKEETFRRLEIVKRLWAGEKLELRNGAGQMASVRIYPTPYQKDLPIWVTAAGSPATFERAGTLGANVLTHLLDQDVDVLAEKIDTYRQARARHGHDPQSGIVTCMLHSFVGEDDALVREQARAPYCQYLKNNLSLAKGLAFNRGHQIDFDSLSDEDLDRFLNFLYDRFVNERALIGAPEQCTELVGRLWVAGVDEIAGLLDFGPPEDLVLGNLVHLNKLRQLCQALPVDEHLRPDFVLVPPSAVDTAVAKLETLGLSALRDRCKQPIDLDELRSRWAAADVELTNTSARLEELWQGEQDVLGRIRVDAESDTAERSVHQVLAAALQVATALVPPSAEGSEAPLSILPRAASRVVTHQTLVKDEIWSHAILRSGPADDGALTTDLRLFDSTGEPVADVAGLKLEPLAKVRPQEETVADWFYCLGWEVSAPNADEVGAPSSAGTWLIFADAQGVAERVVERLEVAGQACQVVENDALPSLRDDAALGEAIVRERLEQVLADDSTCCGVLYLRGLDATPTEVLTAEALMRDQYRAAGALLLVIQALAAVEGSEPPALWVATQGVMAIGETDRALALSQAPLWPLGRTAAAEHPRSWGGLIDLDPATDADTSAAELLQAVHAGDRENQVAYRGGERYVARLERRTVDVTRTLSLRPDGSYLITGGLKGIGYELARWMIDQGARHLILVGRTRLPDRMTWQTLDDTAPQIDLVRKVQALEEAGAEVMHPALDVTDEQQIVDFLEEHREQGRPPIRGVLHAASVWQDRDGKSLVRPLTQTELASIETIFPPKIVGAWLLQQHLRDQPVDFFKFFSAGAALLGSAGQGNYAAANGFLDTLAHELSRQGRKAVSCNWGPINGVGFSATDEGRMIHNLWERRGVKSISPAQVLEATGLLIAHGWPQAGVMCTDWDLLKQSYSETLSVPWYGKLVDVSVVQRKVDILAVLEQTEPSERLETFAEFLQSEVVAVMGFSAAEAPELDQGLFEMGLDSLLALELKNRIQSAVRRDFPVTAVFDYPTINALAGFLLRDILELSCGEETPLAEPESGDILSQIEDLSEEDVELLLARQLEEGHAEEGHTEAGGVSR